MGDTIKRLGTPNLLERVLAGESQALARMKSYGESSIPQHREALLGVYNNAGNTELITFTVVPGSSKSTLVSAITDAIRVRGQRVGVFFISPSSPFIGVLFWVIEFA